MARPSESQYDRTESMVKLTWRVPYVAKITGKGQLTIPKALRDALLREESLHALWKEVNGLHRLAPEDACDREWGGRQLHFWWVNGVRYEFGPNDRQHLEVNVVVCEETWPEPTEQDPDRVAHARFAWVSPEPLNAQNVHSCCTRAARHRWDIEANLNSEKHQGYQSSHAFSYD